MKRALHRGGPETLNIYATTASAYLVSLSLPDIVTKPGQEYLDGILVVDWESMPGASTTYAGRYDLGHTATHEVATRTSSTPSSAARNAKGDFVDDTPAQRSRRTVVRKAGHVPEVGLDPIHNYMDYASDSCSLLSRR